MRFTTGQLRLAVTNPRRLVASVRAAQTDKVQYGNPQRSWMESSWRAYFADNRNPDTLWQVFNEKVSARPMNRNRAGLATGATPMLRQFLEWDSEEEASPQLWSMPSPNVEWRGHTLCLKRDALYLSDNGYDIRLFWTDHDLAPERGDAILMAAATLVHSENDIGQGRIETVSAWQLRRQRRILWSSQELLKEYDRLAERLNDIEAALLA